MVESFLHSVQKNSLECVADKKCGTCDKRTNHTDESLFPEERGLKDVCFDDDCYAKKWTALLEKMLKKEVAKKPGDETAIILEGVPKFYKGTTITLNKTEYQIKKYDYYKNDAKEDDPDSFLVWKFTLLWNSEIKLERLWYKEAEKEEGETAKSEEPASQFVTDDILDTVRHAEPGEVKPEDRVKFAKEIDTSLKKKYRSEYTFRDNLNRDIFKKIIQHFLESPRNVSREYVGEVLYHPSPFRKEIYELITGLSYTEDLAGIETVSPETVIALLFALYIEESDIAPEPDDDDIISSPYLRFSGMDLQEYKELYRETSKELINAAVASSDSPEENQEEEEESPDEEEEET
jgi:hypothetical protein